MIPNQTEWFQGLNFHCDHSISANTRLLDATEGLSQLPVVVQFCKSVQRQTRAINSMANCTNERCMWLPYPLRLAFPAARHLAGLFRGRLQS